MSWEFVMSGGLKQCTQCGGTFPISFFRSHVSDACDTQRQHRPVCRGCEQTKRDERKQISDGRWAVKIRDTVRRHAKRLQIAISELEGRYGWTFARMVHEAQHAYANGCSYCGESFHAMGHGLSDITLDVLNPRAPYYSTNVRWCCMTCNRAKSQMSPEEWGERCAAWERWRHMPKGPLQRRFTF